MAGTVWFHNGRIVMDGGHVVVCDECPCGGCTWTIWCSGSDWRGDDTDTPTRHNFSISLNNATIVDGSASSWVGGEVDEGGSVSVGKRSISITMKNNGGGDPDTYSWGVTCEVKMDNSNEKEVDYSTSHSWAPTSHGSTWDIDASTDCPDMASEDFE